MKNVNELRHLFLLFSFTNRMAGRIRVYLGVHNTAADLQKRTEHRVLKVIKHVQFNPSTYVRHGLGLGFPSQT